MAPAALMVSWAGLTTFAPGLYHAMSRVGGKRKGKKCFSQRAKTKAKLQMREKTTNNTRSRNAAREERRLRPNEIKGSNIIDGSD